MLFEVPILLALVLVGQQARRPLICAAVYVGVLVLSFSFSPGTGPIWLPLLLLSISVACAVGFFVLLDRVEQFSARWWGVLAAGLLVFIFVL